MQHIVWLIIRGNNVFRVDLFPVLDQFMQPQMWNLCNLKMLTMLGFWLSRLFKFSSYTGCIKKGNQTLQCSSAFIIQSTEMIVLQVERPRLLAFDCHHFCEI